MSLQWLLKHSKARARAGSPGWGLGPGWGSDECGLDGTWMELEQRRRDLNPLKILK